MSDGAIDQTSHVPPWYSTIGQKTGRRAAGLPCCLSPVGGSEASRNRRSGIFGRLTGTFWYLRSPSSSKPPPNCQKASSPPWSSSSSDPQVRREHKGWLNVLSLGVSMLPFAAAALRRPNAWSRDRSRGSLHCHKEISGQWRYLCLGAHS